MGRRSISPDPQISVQTISDQEIPCEIWIPKIQCDEDYATCPHEIGHIVGRFERPQSVCGGPSSSLSLAVNSAIRRSASARVRLVLNAPSS
jgi:hypothetical protein